MSRWRLPAPLRALLSALPQEPPALVLAAALNLALAQARASGALDPLLGRVICFEASDAGLVLRLAFGRSGFRVCFGERAADLTLRTTAADFLALALRREDPDTLFFSRRLALEGDTELGLVFKNALDAVDWPPAALRELAQRPAIMRMHRMIVGFVDKYAEVGKSDFGSAIATTPRSRGT